jgi:hypothetical protein
MGGGDDGDGLDQGKPKDILEAHIGGEVAVLEDAEKREDGEGEVTRVDHKEVNEDDPADNVNSGLEDRVHQAASAE